MQSFALVLLLAVGAAAYPTKWPQVWSYAYGQLGTWFPEVQQQVQDIKAGKDMSAFLEEQWQLQQQLQMPEFDLEALFHDKPFRIVPLFAFANQLETCEHDSSPRCVYINALWNAGDMEAVFSELSAKPRGLRGQFGVAAHERGDNNDLVDYFVQWIRDDDPSAPTADTALWTLFDDVASFEFLPPNKVPPSVAQSLAKLREIVRPSHEDVVRLFGYRVPEHGVGNAFSAAGHRYATCYWAVWVAVSVAIGMI